MKLGFHTVVRIKEWSGSVSPVKTILSMVTTAHHLHRWNARAPVLAHSSATCLGGGVLILRGQAF